MRAGALAVGALRAVWGAIGGGVTLYGLYFLVVPLTLVGMIVLGALVVALLALTLMKARIRVSMVVAAMVIAALCTLAAPFAIKGRIYVARCEQMSLDCVMTKGVKFGEASATVLPVADPLKRLALTFVSRRSDRFRMLPTTRTPEGLHLVHAPLERALAEISTTADAAGVYIPIKLPGLVNEFTIDLIYNTDRGDLGGNLEFASGFSPTAYSLVIGRYETSPGFFGSRSQNPPGLAEWREAAIGDLMLEQVLRDDLPTLSAALAVDDPSLSRRAKLRRDVLRDWLTPSTLGGSVFDLQTFMGVRRLLNEHRTYLESLTADDPVYVGALNLISDPMFREPDDQDNAIDTAFIRAQYDYYRALFAEEYDWAAHALPNTAANDRLQAQLNAIDARRLLEFAQRNQPATEDPAAYAQYVKDIWRLMLVSGDESPEERAFAALLAADDMDGINRRIEAQPPSARPHAMWELLAAMDREILTAMSDIILNMTRNDPHAPRTGPDPARVERWKALVNRWAAQQSPLVQDLIAARTHALDSALRISDAMRDLMASVARNNDLENPAQFADVMRELARLAEIAQDQWFMPMLIELGPEFDHAPAAQTAAFARALNTRCNTPNSSAYEKAVLAYLMLDTGTRSASASYPPALVECMWETFGPSAPYANYWPGVAATRALLVLTQDTRQNELDRVELRNVGGDPPWLLPILRRAGRLDASLTGDLGARTQAWEDIVTRYANPPTR